MRTGVSESAVAYDPRRVMSHIDQRVRLAADSVPAR
jgi:hypothetical protein